MTACFVLSLNVFVNRSECQQENGVGESSEEETQETADLKETLKDDIIGNFHDITAGDFKELMTLYRDQRASCKDAQSRQQGEHQRSLWEILEERRRKTDEHVHDGDDHDVIDDVNF